eukprot:9770977-Ditylum_brightwellii.AAC.1
MRLHERKFVRRKKEIRGRDEAQDWSMGLLDMELDQRLAPSGGCQLEAYGTSPVMMPLLYAKYQECI